MVGTGLYYRLGRNSFYFQYRQAGLEPEVARQQARQAGQEIFPAGV